jgi:hypothetical protein
MFLVSGCKLEPVGFRVNNGKLSFRKEFAILALPRKDTVAIGQPACIHTTQCCQATA